MNRNLPHDIMFEIFSLCILNQTPVELPLGRSTAPPLNLTHVCSAWRQAALEMPHLWNNVAIRWLNRDTAVEGSGARSRNMLELFLSRTGSSLISLKIEGEGTHPSIVSFCESIAKVILSYIGRFRHLDLHPAELFTRLLWLPSGNIDALESVRLKYYQASYHKSIPAGDSIYNATLFHLAPSLRSVSISSSRVSIGPIHLDACHFPWNHLTHLDLSEIPVTFRGGHAALRQCVNMISCSLGIVSDGHCFSETVLSDTTLGSLRSLSIHVFPNGRIPELYGEFLQPFILPSLKYLGVYSIHSNRTKFSIAALSSLVKRSSCQLEHFEARHLGPLPVIDLLGRAPGTLTKLSLDCRVDYMFKLLFAAIAFGVLGQKIHTLECSWLDAEHYINILEMQPESRRLQTTLRSMVIRYGDFDRLDGESLANRYSVYDIDVTFEQHQGSLQ